MAKILEDYIQEKNRNISGVFAPLYVDYPDGHVDTLKLPASFSWIESFQIETPNDVRVNQFFVEVYVQHVGQGNFSSNKKDTRDWQELFATEYTIDAPNQSATNGYLRDNPVAFIVPGTVNFNGTRNLITAYDGTAVYGFTFTFEVREHLDRDCS